MPMRCRLPALLVASVVVTLAVALMGQSTSLATVDFARRTGEPCSTCHVRPEGGGEGTAVGSAYARSGYVWPVPDELVQQARPLSNFARILKLIFGYLHIVVTVLWFGTIFYVHAVLRPRQLSTGVPRSEGLIAWFSIALVIATGIGLAVFRQLETGNIFSGVWGTVFVIKIVLTGLMVILAGFASILITRRLRAPRLGQTPPAADSGAITSQTLATHDGKEGAKAVVAYEGKLYDVSQSRLWRGGAHVRRHQAGQDLTSAMAGAPHGPEVLERVPLMGALARAEAPEPRAGSKTRRLFLAIAYTSLALSLSILLCVAWWQWGVTWQARDASPKLALSAASADCIACHTEEQFLAAQISEWQRSAHADKQVGCYECHAAEAGDPDAMAHNGYTISVLVTPKDCSECHVLQAEQFAGSRHSQGADILDSADNVLGERVEGVAATVLGCEQCHGSTVGVEPDGTLTAASWPNTGIGRINPDGSRGACSTCHTRHLFSLAVAREPAACGNCHLGPDHPQKEIYEESKHGIAFLANREHMNLDSPSWVLGQDYSAAPTCVTCHMGDVPGVPSNHNVGLRIAWTLRPEVSIRLENWEARREDMTQACRQCHSPGFYQNFFAQFDEAVELYNQKFAIPAGEIMARLREEGKITDLQFDEKIEWTYFLLWHHEGRRARHGAAMMGPDYVQWHGFFEVAERFYVEFLPQAEELLPGVTEPYLKAEQHQWRVPQE
jgi:hydroxylamine dehydrogenase